MAPSSLHQVGAGGMGSGGLRRLGTILRERSWLIFLCVLLGGALATAYLYYAPKRYAARASVQYQAAIAYWLALANRPQPDTARQLTEIRARLEDPELLSRVVVAQRLSENPRFAGSATGEQAVERALRSLQRRLTIKAPPQGVLLDVIVTDRSPELAARIANATVDELLTDYSRVRTELLEEISSRLRRMQDEIWKELQSVQPVTPPENRLAGAPLQRRQELQEHLRTLTTQLVEADLKRLELIGQLEQARELASQPLTALQVPFIASLPNVASARSVLLQRQVDLERISERYKGKHPDYVAALAARDTADTALQQQVQIAIAQLETEAQSARSQPAELQRQIDAALAEVSALPPERTSETASTPALNEAEILRQIGERVMERLKEFQFGGDVILTPLRQTRRAEPPTAPVGPVQTHVLALGLLGGLTFGLLLSLVFGYGDTSLKSVEDVEEILDLSVLSVVPRLKDNDTELAAAEGFRSLRTSISVSSRGKEPRLIQFTSTSPDEGKTFCALNFAVGLAQQGNKTVLIECDLRRPMAAPSLTLVKVDAAGVSDFLKFASPGPGKAIETKTRHRSDLSFAEIRRKKGEQAEPEGATPNPPVADPSPIPRAPSSTALTLDDIIQRTEVVNLSFIAAGKPVANPTELLSRPRFEELLNGLLQRYDKVVLDSAPVLGVSETLLIASHMQGVCFVVRGNQAPRRAIIRAVEILRRAKTPLLGVVLNGVSPRRSDPYGQDYYYHRAPQ